MISDAVQLSCQELVELVTDYLEGALPEPELRRFEDHLATCAGCQAYLEQIRTTIRLTGTVSAGALAPDAWEALAEAFRDWKSASGR